MSAISHHSKILFILVYKRARITLQYRRFCCVTSLCSMTPLGIEILGCHCTTCTWWIVSTVGTDVASLQLVIIMRWFKNRERERERETERMELYILWKCLVWCFDHSGVNISNVKDSVSMKTICVHSGCGFSVCAHSAPLGCVTIFHAHAFTHLLSSHYLTPHDNHMRYRPICVYRT